MQIAAEMDTAVGGNQSFSVTVLVGKRDETMMELCARRIMADIVKDGSSKPLLLSLALKSHSLQLVEPIVSKIVENKVW